VRPFVDGGQRVVDPPVAQRDDGLCEQVVGTVEVVEQHLVRRTGRPRGTAQREVDQAVDREVVRDALEQFPAPRFEPADRR
jgi:hypothetical protein